MTLHGGSTGKNEIRWVDRTAFARGQALLKYASYIVHLIARVPETENEFARAALFDRILEALADNPMLWGCVLSDTVAPIEQYLSLRPENFDILARFTAEGRLEFGPWLVPPQGNRLELTIRNLLLGMDTLRLLKMPAVIAAIPLAGGQFPQILRGFGISAALSAESEKSADFLIGLDGSAVGLLKPHEVTFWDSQRERFAETAAGRHLMAEVIGEPDDWLYALSHLREILPTDDVFFSSRTGCTKASMTNLPLPTQIQEMIAANREVPSVPGIGESSLEKMLLQEIEPLSVWVAYERSDFTLKKPQRILQKLWREFLLGEKTTQAHELRALYPDQLPELVSVNTDSFEIMAVKLREDGQPGVIVRGYNRTGYEQIVKVKPWRNFARCDVLHMDESRTGGQLHIDGEGAIQFTAHPHRILTLGLRD
ncbi:MAG: hypothetical protein KJ064_03040 [Anaerolineae bacterium]|nr:hypothetical protein [Anaerolineae bacterium]